MGPFISRRLDGLVQSDIRYMSRECERLGGINLAQGNCDLPTPQLVCEAAAKAIFDQQNRYTFPEGVAPLRQAIAAKLARDNGLRADPATEIIVTSGATGGFAATLQALLNPGDGVLVMEPYYGYHLNVLLSIGLEAHYLALDPPAFELHEDALRAALRPNTRAIVVCTPSNPSGKMLDLEELQAIARVADEHDLLVITDEIYEYITYDGRRHISPASVDGLWDRTVTIMGMSKTLRVTGWRLGYVAAPAALAKPINLVNDLYYVCAPTPLQHGVIAGLDAPPSFFATLKAEFQHKRDTICASLVACGLNPVIPEGSYFVLADIRHLGYPSARAAALDLLQRSGVAAVPGTAFYRGATGEGILRFCFAKEDDVLEDVARRLTALAAVAPLA